MNLKSCKCGIVLDFDSNIKLQSKNKDIGEEVFFYICPVCKFEHLLEEYLK